MNGATTKHLCFCIMHELNALRRGDPVTVEMHRAAIRWDVTMLLQGEKVKSE